MSRILVVSVALGAVLSTGCAASNGDDAGAPEDRLLDDAELIQERVLAEFDVGGEHHTFLQWGSGSDAMLAHRVQGAADAISPMVSLLDQEGARLTTLEVFRALAPEGLEPPPELQERHVREAQALGRDDSVLEVTIDKAQHVVSTGALNPPAGMVACDSSLFFPPQTFWTSQVITSGSGNSFLCATGTDATVGTQSGIPDTNSCPFSTQAPMMVGVCTTSSSSARPVAFFGFPDNWQFTPAVPLNPNQYVIWNTVADLDNHRMAAFVTSSSNFQYGLRAGVRDIRFPPFP